MGQKFTIGSDGKPVYSSSSEQQVNAAGITAAYSSPVQTSNVTSVLGANLGVGHGLYTGANGSKSVVMDFRSIVAGNGITIQTDANSMTITSSQTAGAGVTGPQGGQGSPGADGVAGPQGDAGVAGIAGADGASGVAGIAGVNGTDGADGAQGIPGEPGTPADMAAIDDLLGDILAALIIINGTGQA